MTEAKKNIIIYLLSILLVNIICICLLYSTSDKERKTITVLYIFLGGYQMIKLIPKIIQEIKKDREGN